MTCHSQNSGSDIIIFIDYMKISYNWLSEYLPEIIEPEKLSKILTSVGLEVESWKNLKK